VGCRNMRQHRKDGMHEGSDAAQTEKLSLHAPDKQASAREGSGGAGGDSGRVFGAGIGCAVAQVERLIFLG